jgi:hypothetical protein
VAPLRTLLVYAETLAGATLSYQRGWPRVLAADPRFACTPLDLASTSRFTMRAPRRFDLVLLLHSVFSNSRMLAGRLQERVTAVRARKVWFIGNEYKLMPDKLQFARELGIDLLVSQIESEKVRELYRRALDRPVVSIPNTGLDTRLISPGPPLAERPLDLGYRAFDGPAYLGHDERRRLLDRFTDLAARRGIVADLSLDPDARFTESEWAAFLQRCKGQLGFEAGGDYFELDDRSRFAVEVYVKEHPAAFFDEIREAVFANYGPRVSGRTISGRVIEAAGAKTAQLLIEGEYGGYLAPWTHYIPLRADLSNADEALDVLADEAKASEIAERAYEVVATELTWERLVDRLYESVQEIL